MFFAVLFVGLIYVFATSSEMVGFGVHGKDRLVSVVASMTTLANT